MMPKKPTGMYVMPGGNSAGGFVTGIELLAFAVDTQGAVNKATGQTDQIASCVAQNWRTNSIYNMAGTYGLSGTTKIYQFIGTIDTTNPVNKGTLAAAHGDGPGGTESEDGGYCCGGYVAGLLNTCDRFSFATDTTTALAKGTLAAARSLTSCGTGF